MEKANRLYMNGFVSLFSQINIILEDFYNFHLVDEKTSQWTLEVHITTKEASYNVTKYTNTFITLY